MRVLYYCPEYYSQHGGRTHARGFFNALQRLPDVSKSCLYPKADSDTATQGVRKNSESRDRLWFLPKIARRLFRFFWPNSRLTKRLIDEIKAHGCDALVIRTGVCTPIIGRIKKACPDTVICLEINAAGFDESFAGLPLRRSFQRLEVFGFSKADAIVVVSSYLKHYLEERGIPPEKIVVNQNGVDVDAVRYSGPANVRQRYRIPDKAFLLGYIGGMESFRRLPEVVRHIANLRQAGNDDIFLLIIGDGNDMPAVQTAIEANADILGKSVICPGWQPHAEIPQFLAAFDVAVFPFTNDYCSPLKLFEYLGAGVPAIGPNTTAVREVFKDGVHLKLVKQDGSDFTDAVLSLKNNPEFRKELGRNGQRLVLAEYTWQKNAERVVTHIQRFLAHVNEHSS